MAMTQVKQPKPLESIKDFLDDEINIATTPDYSAAHNGLQLQNDGTVRTVAAAVDASEPVIKKAGEAGAELLIVHHGMFWFGVQKVEGAFYRKLKLAMDNNLAIYSAHIPLDVHPEHGNNAILAHRLGMTEAEPCGDYKGVPLGLRQELDLTLQELLQRVSCEVGEKITLCEGYGGLADPVGMIGVVTGGAGAQILEMHELGINTFITGEGPHWSHPLAEELGMNVIYAGHYATEVFGVERMAELVAQKFEIEKIAFVDHPTGL